jgi:transposase InsO family protein
VIQAAPRGLRDGLSVSGACAVLDLNRTSVYRWQAAGRPSEPLRRGRPPVQEATLVAAVEEIVLAHPGYGRPRVTRELRRQQQTVNPKRVQRLLREGGWLQLRRRRKVRTTNSQHGYSRYPNLLADCGWRTLKGPNQAWGADLTYVRLGAGFCYLAVVLDLWSRKLVGWDLSRTLEGDGALRALEQALETRRPATGWIHHSDRGVQYACHQYVRSLEAAGARISMCATGEPKENAVVERVIRTIKEEEVDLQEYESLEEAELSLGQFIEDVYNRKRLHSALGYRPPTEFEELFAASLVG